MIQFHRPVCVRPRWTDVLCVILFAGCAGRLFAADPIKYIPSDACAVVIFPNIEKTLEHFTDFAKRINPDSDGMDMEDFEDALGLECGILDPEKPVVVIFPRPMFDIQSAIIAFVPRDENTIEELGGGREGVAVPFDGMEGDGFAVSRDGCCFAAHTRKALRVIKAVEKKSAFVESLDDRQRQMLKEGEILVHIPLARWREEKIAPAFSLLTGLLRLSIGSTEMPTDAETTSAIMDYFIEAARGLLDEMQSVSMAVYLNDGEARFVHHQRFDPAGKAAAYFRQAAYFEANHFAVIPDQPFLFAMACCQKNQTGESLSTRIFRGLCNVPAIAAKIDEPIRKKLLETLKAADADTRGSFTVLGLNPEKGCPMTMFGGYAMANPEKGIEHFKYIHENAGPALAAVMPGAGAPGTFKAVNRGGVKCQEIMLKDEPLRGEFREQLEFVYGKNAAFQLAAFDQTYVTYCMAEAPAGVGDFQKARQTGHTLDKNPQVRRIRSMLPAKAHTVVIANLGALLSFSMSVAPMPSHALQQARSSTSPIDPGSMRDGPMVGWSLDYFPNACTGTFAVEAADVAKLIKLAKSMPKQQSETRVRVVTPPKKPKIPAPPADE